MQDFSSLLEQQCEKKNSVSFNITSDVIRAFPQEAGSCWESSRLVLINGSELHVDVHKIGLH